MKNDFSGWDTSHLHCRWLSWISRTTVVLCFMRLQGPLSVTQRTSEITFRNAYGPCVQRHRITKQVWSVSLSSDGKSWNILTVSVFISLKTFHRNIFFFETRRHLRSYSRDQRDSPPQRRRSMVEAVTGENNTLNLPLASTTSWEALSRVLSHNIQNGNSDVVNQHHQHPTNPSWKISHGYSRTLW